MTTSMSISSNTTTSTTLPKRPVQKKQNRLGPYNLLQTLGEGEFGKVKLGIHTETGQEVAIKLIKKEGAGSDTRINKVEREISVLKTLNHPYIVKLFNVVETEKYIGIILEYASGGELFEYILAHRYLKEKDAKRFFAQLMSSVQYMHKRKIVHRDLKLENLLLDKNRNIIVTDFGFANQFSSAADDMMATTCGSPCYAAPELVVNAGLYAGSAVDIWSCGVILYAMLCGFLPFDDDPSNPDSDNINQLYRYILSTNLMFPSYVSVEARDLLEKMLVPDPVKRCSLDYIIKHPWLQAYQEYLKKDAAPLDMDSVITSKLSSMSTAHKVNHGNAANDKPNNFVLTSSMSTTVQSTQPKKSIAPNSAASRKTHIPVLSSQHDRFAPVANDKYILTSNNKRNVSSTTNNNGNSKTGAFRHFSIGRSSATTTPVEKPSIHATVTPTTTTRTSKVPNFISRKPVKKEEEEVSTEKVSPSDLNPEKSLSSPLLAQDSKIPAISAIGSIRKNQRRGTDRILNFFTGGRASHIPVVTSKTEERRLLFSLEKEPEVAIDSVVSDIVTGGHYHDVNERIQSSIIDINQDDDGDVIKDSNEEEEQSRTLHSSSETSTIGDSTPSLHVLVSTSLNDASSPLSPVPSSIQQQNILKSKNAVTTNALHIDTSSSITIQNEDIHSPIDDSNNIIPSTVVSDIIQEEEEECSEEPQREDETSSNISAQQKMVRGSNISSASILSDNGGSVSINSSIVSFKDTPRRTPLLFASQKGSSQSIIMRQQHYNQPNHRSSIDNASSILSNERQDNASVSSASTNPQPEVSTSTRLTSAKNGVANVMGDGGRKAMAAVRRSIYRKHRSQPPPQSVISGQMSDNSSPASSIRASTAPKEPIISFAKSRFEETGNQVTQKRAQKNDNNHRNTWSAATLISSASELPNKPKNSSENPNVVISKNQSTVTSSTTNLPPKKTGKKMMDWIKKKSHAKETKKEALSSTENSAVKPEVPRSSTRLTSSNQILTKSRKISTKNDTPTSVITNDTKNNNNNNNNSNNKITATSNTNKRTNNNVVSILATSPTVTTTRASILPTPSPSPTPQSPQQKQADEPPIVIPLDTEKSKRPVRALSGNEASLAASLKKETGIDKRIQFHQGAIDRAALTSQSPVQVVKDIARILRILGIDAKAEASNPYILRCCRRKARTLIAAELLKKDQEENNNDNDRLVINESAITSTSEISLLAPSTKDAQSLSSRSSIDPSSADTRGLEPIYGDASIDNGDEIRFAVEICRFKNLPGLYIVDMRRLKGSAWAYKFLYHKLIDFLDLRKNGSYIHN